LKILGLHFGHDASISVIENGKVLICLEIERKNRIRHAIGITFEDIQFVLKEIKCSIEEIKYCSVTSTQNIEYIFPNPNKLKFEIDFKNQLFKDKNSWLKDINKKDLNKKMFKRLLKLTVSEPEHVYVKRLSKKIINLKKGLSLGSLEDFYTNNLWRKKNSLEKIFKYFNKKKISLNEKLSQSMQIPINLYFGNKIIKGWLMSHHFAHAAYSFYKSGFKKSIVLTQDGSLPRGGYWGGMCYYGNNNKLYPVLPHYLSIGKLYEGVSVLLGFNIEEGPGKMMGLAPYGKPVFYNKKFVGNFFDYEKLSVDELRIKLRNWKRQKFDIPLNKWVSHIIKSSKEKKYNLKYLGDVKNILKPINVNIAASTQKLIEETLLKTSIILKKKFKENKFFSENLCLSGGTFLNCPANSKIFNKANFKKIFVPPAIHDGGLSMGSALAIYFNTLNRKNIFNNGNKTSTAYLGFNNQQKSIPNNLNKYSKKIKFYKKKNIYRLIAELLSKDEVIAVVFSRSEVGPRALGHRSILSNPLFKKNWKRVNLIKKRELWRPFAPAVLEKDSKKWFSNVPKVSPFMLFTAKVINNKIPAVTHVDGSARIQTVDKNSKEIYKILKEFKKITNVPVLLNTSFNGPGQPIIENVDEAVQFYLDSKINRLIIHNFVIERKEK